MISALATLGEFVRIRRTDLGMSQTDLAVRIGVTKQAVSDVERDKWTMAPRHIRQYATALGVDVHEILARIEQRHEAKVAQR
jgi:transcriptional regulator with XRE-family HTH domain